MYAVRILFSQPLRLSLTIAGVALCMMLMMFLNGIYTGVSDGSVEYIRQNRADLWVLQDHATNILRGTSLLRKPHEMWLGTVEGVASVSPVLLLLPTVAKDTAAGTVFLVGFDFRTGIGGPPAIVAGKDVADSDEIVLDQAFARRLGIMIGDRVRIRDNEFTMVGLSSGTNALVIQYAFVDIETARGLMQVPGISTSYLIRLQEGYNTTDVAASIQSDLPDVSVMTHEEFLANNIREMKSGFLPVLFLVAVLGSVVLTTIVSLLLSITILERRLVFAVLKAIGSPPRLLIGGIVLQSLLIIGLAGITALIVFFPVRAAVEVVAPQVTAVFSPGSFALLLGLSGILGLLSAMISLQRLRSVYPMEAFS